MADHWLVIDSALGDAPFNMALDEVLLEDAGRLAKPVLRFYGWTAPAATFGYFQRHADVASWTRLRPLIRRPTGGGLVPHDADWTYSIVIPPGHEWYRARAVDSYRRLHEWIRDAFSYVDISTTLAAVARKKAPGQCFAGPEQFDLVYQSQKLAGAAQRRTRAGLLIQGSIQPTPTGIERAAWQEAMLSVGRSKDVVYSPWRPDDQVMEHAAALARSKYSQDDYNQRR